VVEFLAALLCLGISVLFLLGGLPDTIFEAVFRRSTDAQWTAYKRTAKGSPAIPRVAAVFGLSAVRTAWPTAGRLPRRVTEGIFPAVLGRPN
jgi:hypothetical protein